MDDPAEQIDRSEALKKIVRQYFQDPDFSLGNYEPAVRISVQTVLKILT